MKRVNYRYNCPINKGTENEPVWEDNLLRKSLPFSDLALEIAKREAYNGEYTIDDDGQTETEPQEPGDAVTWSELDTAYQEGVDSV